MTVTCTQCGTGSPPGNRFCGQCGTPLPPSPGNLPVSARPVPGPPPPTAGWIGVASPCWRCGNAVDPTRQPNCPTCGAALSAPAHPVTVPPPSGPPPPMPPPGGAGGATGWAEVASGPPPAMPYPDPDPAPHQATRRRESAVSGPVLTVVVAIGIVLVLAVVGILAGQVIGR